MTAFGSLESAIDAMRQGAYDYLTKPFKLPELSLVVKRAVEDQQLREENRRLRAEVERRYSFDNILGRSKAMQGVFEQIRAVAETDAPVLLLGESGSGKELVARAIHWHSGRRDKAFVAVNCAAIPETLLESELFGHEKGAFTGADRKRRGLFVEAQGGTLLLDEIAEMPQSLQVKLLRALQDRVVRPVGGNEEIKVDLRLISATNRDLPAFVRQGKFREDLYYRVAVIPIRIPSLRERPEDIPILAEHFLKRAAAGMGKEIDGLRRRGGEVAPRAQLAGQRPGAGERRRAGGHPRQGPRSSRATTSGSSSRRGPAASWACARPWPRWRASTSVASSTRSGATSGPRPASSGSACGRCSGCRPACRGSGPG